MKQSNLLHYLIGVLLLASCKVDNKLTDTVNPQKILTVKEVKNTASILIKKNNSSVNDNFTKRASSRIVAQTDLPNYDFDWDNQYSNDKIPDFPVIMVPLKNNKVDRSVFPDMNPQGYRVVAFQHDANYETKAAIFEIHPDTAYLNRKMMLKNIKLEGQEFSDYQKLVTSEDMCGYAFVWDVDGTFKGAFHLTSGNYDKIFDQNMKLTHAK